MLESKQGEASKEKTLHFSGWSALTQIAKQRPLCALLCLHVFEVSARSRLRVNVCLCGCIFAHLHAPFECILFASVSMFFNKLAGVLPLCLCIIFTEHIQMKDCVCV